MRSLGVLAPNPDLHRDIAAAGWHPPRPGSALTR